MAAYRSKKRSGLTILFINSNLKFQERAESPCPILKKENPDFIGYEYREININNKLVDLYLDNYPNFGWQIISAEKAQPVNSKMIIKLKRNRHIANKQELTRLQRKFEAQLSQVDKLERKKTVRASATALTIGFLGSVFLAASVMLFHYNIFLSFVLGIPGLIGWILPY